MAGHPRANTCKGLPRLALCKKKRRALDAQQVPNKTDDRTTNRTMSLEGTPLQVGEGK
jgi:hypothetical protein